MRKLLKKERMQADSLPEIRGALNRIAFEDGQGLRAGNRPFSEGHVINAAILALAAMAQEERRAVLKRGEAVLNALLSLEEAIPEQALGALIAATQKPPGEAEGEEASQPDVTINGGGGSRPGKGRGRDIG